MGTMLLAKLSVSVLSAGSFLVLIPGWVGLCTVWDPVGLCYELSCEAGSFSCFHNPHRFLQPEVLRLFPPRLEPWVVRSICLPSFSSRVICTLMWDCLLHQPPPCHESSLPLLPVSILLTSLRGFFFNSLVVRLPYSSIFWQFWLFFVLKFVVLLLVMRGSKVYLPMPPSWPEGWSP